MTIPAEQREMLEELACEQVKKSEKRRKIFSYVHEDFITGAEKAWELATQVERERIVGLIYDIERNALHDGDLGKAIESGMNITEWISRPKESK